MLNKHLVLNEINLPAVTVDLKPQKLYETLLLIYSKEHAISWFSHILLRISNLQKLGYGNQDAQSTAVNLKVRDRKLFLHVYKSIRLARVKARRIENRL